MEDNINEVLLVVFAVVLGRLLHYIVKISR